MSISFFDNLVAIFLHFWQHLSLRMLGRSSEVECNPKMSISFFDDFVNPGGGGVTPANSQTQMYLQKNLPSEKFSNPGGRCIAKNQNVMLTQNSI